MIRSFHNKKDVRIVKRRFNANFEGNCIQRLFTNCWIKPEQQGEVCVLWCPIENIRCVLSLCLTSVTLQLSPCISLSLPTVVDQDLYLDQEGLITDSLCWFVLVFLAPPDDEIFSVFSYQMIRLSTISILFRLIG